MHCGRHGFHTRKTGLEAGPTSAKGLRGLGVQGYVGLINPTSANSEHAERALTPKYTFFYKPLGFHWKA